MGVTVGRVSHVPVLLTVVRTCEFTCTGQVVVYTNQVQSSMYTVRVGIPIIPSSAANVSPREFAYIVVGVASASSF